jgi:transposase InsO family protein
VAGPTVAPLVSSQFPESICNFEWMGRLNWPTVRRVPTQQNAKRSGSSLSGKLLTALPIHPVTVSVARRVGQIDGENPAFRGQVRDMGIQELLCTPRSPWQWAYVERVIGSIRRECLDHVIVFDESSLRRILRSYLDYYHRARTHLSLGKDSPEPRSIQPPGMGSVVAVSQVGGLHHRYERRTA